MPRNKFTAIFLQIKGVDDRDSDIVQMLNRLLIQNPQCDSLSTMQGSLAILKR